MSYLTAYETRITNLFDGVKQIAVFFAVADKLPVDYEVMSKTFLSKKFDLDSRGLNSVFRILSDRVRQVTLPPTNKSKQWSSSVDKVCSRILPLIEDALEKSRVMTLGYLETVELLNGPKASWVEILRSLGFYFGLALSNELEEFLKYQTASLCALSLSNVCDKAPECVSRGRWRIGDFIPYCKRVTFWLRKLCVQKRTNKAVQIAFSIYTTKRVAPAANEVFVKKSLEKNLIALTTERNLPDVIRLKEAVVRTVRELHYYAMHPQVCYDTPNSASNLRNKLIRSKHLNAKTNHSKIPSLAACYENTRSGGGAFMHLLKRLHLTPQRTKNPTCKCCRLFGQSTTGDIIVCERPLLGFARRLDRFVQPVAVYGVLDDEDLHDLMHPSLDGYGGSVFVRREPILEPFKVRIISKGEAVPYQRAQNYQPFLWNLLQLADCFCLTGRPMEDYDLQQVLEFGKRSLQHCQIVSGDYSAATDNLHPWLCTAAINEICHLWRIPFEDALNLSSCLTSHLIDDRTIEEFKMNKLTGHIDDGDLELPSTKYADSRQVWGQLMGSPVSFPILCIINAAVTRDAMEKSFGREISLREHAFLVNGDDVIFTIPSAQYQVWVRNVTSAGLSPSIGKNYVSRRYGVINSQLYDCGKFWDLASSEVVVSQVPILKLNLVHCAQHDSTERRTDANLFIGEALRHGKTLEGRMQELVKGWDVEMRDKLLKRAYHYAKPLLAILPPVSWVLPKCLGGLGLPATSDHKVSDLHLKLASMILCLDQETRREVVKLQWMREPGNVFCEETNSQLNSIYDSLEIKTVLSTSKTPDALYGPLIRSNLGYGVDLSIIDPSLQLKTWKSMYSKWVRRVQKVKWTDKTDHNQTGLHAMKQDRAMQYDNCIWTHETSAYLT